MVRRRRRRKGISARDLTSFKRVARLIDIDLDRDRHTGQRAGIGAGGDRAVDTIGLIDGVAFLMLDDRIDRRIDRFQPSQRIERDLTGRHFASAHPGGDISRRCSPQLCHGTEILLPRQGP